MQPIAPAFSPVNICFACDDNYAPHLAVALYSLLCNANSDRFYDIIILFREISEENKERITRTGGLFPHCSVRFVNVSEFHDSVKDRVGSYITAATNYRLFLLGELFGKYDRMLYLDCDIIVTGDISELFDTDLGGKSIAAAKMAEARYYIRSKKAIFFEGMPYNFTDYCQKILEIRHMENYFYAGVILFDLKRCRKLTSHKAAVELLNSKKWRYNDQDTLNILFNDSVKMLDLKWNYTNNIEQFCSSPKPSIRELYSDARRTDYGVIHYASGKKPWNADVPLGEHYHKYNEKLQEVLYNVNIKEEKS